MVLDMLIRGSFSAVEVGPVVDNESSEESEDEYPWEIKGRRQGTSARPPSFCSLSVGCMFRAVLGSAMMVWVLANGSSEFCVAACVGMKF